MWVFLRSPCMRVLQALPRVISAKARTSSSTGDLNVVYSDIIQDRRVQRFFDEFDSQFYSGVFDRLQTRLPRSYFQSLLSSRKELKMNLEIVRALRNDCSNQKDMLQMADEEEAVYLSDITDVECELIRALVPSVNDLVKEIFVEITAGVGGQEAMLFTKVLVEMYQGYSDFKGWDAQLAALDITGIGGVRQATIYISGENVYSIMMHESGVHRVQRVPSTEKSGRIHTSTATVAVFPQPSDIEVVIHDRDLVIETMRSSGAGGQHVNTTDSAVRITHVPSGMVVECQTDRSQIQNKKIAMKRLRAKLYEKEKQQIANDIKKTRKQQVGTSARSDKVRTYNFMQDRVTDHRLMESSHNIMEFIEGGPLLNKVIMKLVNFAENDRLKNFVLHLDDEGI